MPINTYQQALDWLYTFVPFEPIPLHAREGIALARMERMLARLGSPHTRYPSILIAGTKGKGSTAAMLASILRAAGYHTGLFTSPHLHTFRERIRVGNQLISRKEIIAGANELESIADEFPDATWFQWVTALALNFFAEQPIDIAVLEVGLGGRLDATNVVQPRVCVITSISYDHTAILGNTLTEIAREKAGIIKPNTPVISAPQADEAREVIEAIAREKNAPLILIGRDYEYELLSMNLQGETFTVKTPPVQPGRVGRRLRFFLPLLGRHQVVNATVALATAAELQKQGFEIEPRDLEDGLARVQWDVRFEILARAPFIIADGAHNRASAHELVATLDALFANSRVHFIFGASADKDIAGMFAEMLPRASSLILTQSHHVRATPPEKLAARAAAFGIEPQHAANVETALALARTRSTRDDVICVTGSLFVAAEARAAILKARGVQVETDD